MSGVHFNPVPSCRRLQPELTAINFSLWISEPEDGGWGDGSQAIRLERGGRENRGAAMLGI